MDTSLTSFLKGDVEIIGVESLIIINVTRCRYVKVNDSKQQQRWAGYEVSNLFFFACDRRTTSFLWISENEQMVHHHFSGRIFQEVIISPGYPVDEPTLQQIAYVS